MTIKVPEKHRAVAHAWVDGADIQFRDSVGITEWTDHTWGSPLWHIDLDYRVKPKTVIKYKMVYKTEYDEWVLTDGYYASVDELRDGLGMPITEEISIVFKTAKEFEV